MRRVQRRLPELAVGPKCWVGERGRRMCLKGASVGYLGLLSLLGWLDYEFQACQMSKMRAC